MGLLLTSDDIVSEDEKVISFREHMLSKLTPNEKMVREEGIECLGIDIYEGDFWLGPKADTYTMYNEMGDYTLQNDVNLHILTYNQVTLTTYQVCENQMEFGFGNKEGRLIIWVNEEGKLQSQIKK
jgi:hypothetical protein